MQMFVPSSLPPASARGIRVIVCEPESSVRDEIRRFIDADAVLTLAAETRNWSECEFALQDLAPELLIARSELIPIDWASRGEDYSPFPIVIALRSASSAAIARAGFAGLSLPAAPEMVRRSLNQAVRDIYDRKAKQLLYLVDRYIEASHSTARYSSTIVVEQEGKSVQLHTRDVVSIVAARKWVSICTRSGRFLLREPIHSLAAKLDPTVFIRIHRSIIINRSYVDNGAEINPRSSYVVMVNGARHPVGPNYRNALYHAMQSEDPELSYLQRRIS